MSLVLGVLLVAALGPVLTATAMLALLLTIALAVLPPVERSERVTLLDILQRKQP